MYLNVFDDSFNRIAVISNYTEVEFTLHYYNHSMMIAYLDATKANIELFINNNEEDRIITKSTDLKRGYIIESVDFTDEGKMEIMIMAKSLSIMTSWRIIEWQQRFKGNIEDVLKGFVNANAINPSRAIRRIPNLTLGANAGIQVAAEEAYNNKMLDESLWEICMKYEVSFEILMNHEVKKYEFVVYQGADRSTEQTKNPHIIFSKSFRNINTQSYTDDKSNYKSTPYVAGEGEGINRTILRLNDNIAGFKRREIFFDARDLQSTYRDSNDNEVTLTPAQYTALLRERGLNRLSEYIRVQMFKSESDANSQFKFNENYFLGDKTTTRNDDLNLVMHSRVVVAKEKYNRQGYSLNLEFGSNTPTLIDKIKRVIKNGHS